MIRTENDQNYIPLCAPILGLASTGHDVCQTLRDTETATQAALKAPASGATTTPVTLANRASQYIIDPGKIHMGSGEYIVFHQLSDNTATAPTKNTFEQVYQIFNQYAPGAIINNRGPSTTAMEHCMNRYEIIKALTKTIDPTLEIAFVPRTLYELVLIRKCMWEDLKNQSICDLANDRTHQEYLKDGQKAQGKHQQLLEKFAKTRLKNKCWHLCFFQGRDTNYDFAVEETAYRLNQALVKGFAPTSRGFTYQEFANFVEKEISFLRFYYHTTSILKSRMQKIDLFKEKALFGGPTASFSAHADGRNSMSIQTMEDAQIIREALALDCCRAAQTHFFLYRGATFQFDNLVLGASHENIPQSLSYGTSLFAGCVRDVTATPFYYMRYANGNDAYVIPIPFDQLNSSPFYIPTTNAIAQLFASGELFHGRSKFWRGADMQSVGGIMSSPERLKEATFLQSNLTKDQLNEHFLQYKKGAIHLKHPKCRKEHPISKL